MLCHHHLKMTLPRSFFFLLCHTPCPAWVIMMQPVSVELNTHFHSVTVHLSSFRTSLTLLQCTTLATHHPVKYPHSPRTTQTQPPRCPPMWPQSSSRQLPRTCCAWTSPRTWATPSLTHGAHGSRAPLCLVGGGSLGVVCDLHDE